MPLLGVLPAWPGAFALGFTRGGAGYARSPQPLPVGARSDSSEPGPSTCAAKAVVVARPSRPAMQEIDRIKISPWVVRLARMDYGTRRLHARLHGCRRPEVGQICHRWAAPHRTADERRHPAGRRIG